ncbi:inositol hexakisphosphate kinase 1-like isoform X2 [Tubulanus polymorphus]
MPVCLKPFQHQVGGHSNIYVYDSNTVCKSGPSIGREIIYYESLPNCLKEFTPDYRGCIDAQFEQMNDGEFCLITYPGDTVNGDTEHFGSFNQKCLNSFKLNSKFEEKAKSEADATIPAGDKNPWSTRCQMREFTRLKEAGKVSNPRKFILLENVVGKLKQPSILDLKVGTRQYGDEESLKKRQQKIATCQKTTSCTLGLRLTGMMKYQENIDKTVCKNKYFGRSLTSETFVDEIEFYLSDDTGIIRKNVVHKILSKLLRLRAVIADLDTFRFYSTSLLFIYGKHNEPVTANDNTRTVGSEDDDKVRTVGSDDDEVLVYMIDFAHSTHSGFPDPKVVYEGPDTGFLLGLDTLIGFIQHLLTEARSS